MRIVYYTHPAFFEAALGLIRALSLRAEVHLLLEISPGAWQTASFDLQQRPLPLGIVAGDQLLRDQFPAGVRQYWRSAASFNLVVHTSRRSLHPASWVISRKALRFAADMRPDVLHVDDVDVSPRLALALTTFRRVPVVVTVHDPEPHSGERNWRTHLARRLAFPAADRFILYNAALRAAFAARHRIAFERVETAPLGVYDVLREWSGAWSSAPTTVLFFGRLAPYKGLDVFYEAARLVAQRVEGLRFVVAGQPVRGYTPPPPPDLGGRGEIDVMARYLPTTDIVRLLQAASVVVCPYRDATQSGVVLSAFAFDVPVVASAVGGLPEYVVPEQTGLLAPVGDAGAVADAISRILLEPGLAVQLRRGIAAAAAERLSWGQTADVLLRVYASLDARTAAG